VLIGAFGHAKLIVIRQNMKPSSLYYKSEGMPVRVLVTPRLHLRPSVAALTSDNNSLDDLRVIEKYWMFCVRI
jgi:hypothetical protein